MASSWGVQEVPYHRFKTGLCNDQSAIEGTDNNQLKSDNLKGSQAMSGSEIL